MKTLPTGLTTFKATATSALIFDLYTITLQSGAVYRWTDADIDIPSGGYTFTRGPLISRSRITQARGLQVGNMTMTLASPSYVIGGQPLPYFVAAGGFENAAVQVDRAVFDVNAALQGVSPQYFVGNVSDISPTRMGAKLTVKPATAKLQTQTPSDTYQAACLNNFGDANCGKSKAGYTIVGTVSAVGAGNNPTLTVTPASSVAASWFDLGTATFSSGANAGIGRTVQKQTGSGTSVTLQFARPFPFALSVGNTLNVLVGCDKLVTTCNSKFSNLLRFRGTPFIPVVETAA